MRSVIVLLSLVIASAALADEPPKLGDISTPSVAPKPIDPPMLRSRGMDVANGARASGPQDAGPAARAGPAVEQAGPCDDGDQTMILGGLDIADLKCDDATLSETVSMLAIAQAHAQTQIRRLQAKLKRAQATAASKPTPSPSPTPTPSP